MGQLPGSTAEATTAVPKTNKSIPAVRGTGARLARQGVTSTEKGNAARAQVDRGRPEKFKAM